MQASRLPDFDGKLSIRPQFNFLCQLGHSSFADEIIDLSVNQSTLKKTVEGFLNSP